MENAADLTPHRKQLGTTLLALALLGGATTAADAKLIQPFSSVQKVFAKSCAFSGCHSSVSPQGGLVLDSEDASYANLVGQPGSSDEAKAAGLLRVAPGDPAGSLLIRKLRGLGPGGSMPSGGAPLPKSTIKAIELWIARGALPTDAECPKGVKRNGRCSSKPAVVKRQALDAADMPRPGKP